MTAILISRFFLDLREATTGGMQLGDADSVSSADIFEQIEISVDRDLERLEQDSSASRDSRGSAYSEETAVEILQVGNASDSTYGLLMTSSTFSRLRERSKR